jgi:hypothetical protein
MGGAAKGRCGYGTFWGLGVRGSARQPTWVRRSVPIRQSTSGATSLQNRGCWPQLKLDPLGVDIE